jgi:excisionase family DNA binding protein
MLADQIQEPFVATEEEALIAKEAAAKLRPVADANTDVRVRVVGKADVVVPLPARVVKLVVELLLVMAEGKPVSFIPHQTELTTQQAADFLNVSRPYLVGLLEKNQIPYRKVGTHRRILVPDLIEYKKKSDEDRRAAIRKMVAEAQKLGLP